MKVFGIILAVLATVFVLSCESDTATSTPTQLPTSMGQATRSPVPTPTIQATGSPAPTATTPLATATQTPTATLGMSGAGATIVSAVDGDTIDMSINGQTQRVRLIGVDTPEVFGGVDCFGPDASDFTKSRLTPGLAVGLEKDVSEMDRFGRLLRYVYLPDGAMFNEVLVAEGYAQAVTFPPDVKYQERFLAAQRMAREANKGLWAGCQGQTPTPTLRRRPRPSHR
jgi:micrococcal nuclease